MPLTRPPQVAVPLGEGDVRGVRGVADEAGEGDGGRAAHPVTAEVSAPTAVLAVPLIEVVALPRRHARRAPPTRPPLEPEVIAGGDVVVASTPAPRRAQRLALRAVATPEAVVEVAARALHHGALAEASGDRAVGVGAPVHKAEAVGLGEGTDARVPVPVNGAEAPGLAETVPRGRDTPAETEGAPDTGPTLRAVVDVDGRADHGRLLHVGEVPRPALLLAEGAEGVQPVLRVGDTVVLPEGERDVAVPRAGDGGDVGVPRHRGLELEGVVSLGIGRRSGVRGVPLASLADVHTPLPSRAVEGGRDAPLVQDGAPDGVATAAQHVIQPHDLQGGAGLGAVLADVSDAGTLGPPDASRAPPLACRSLPLPRPHGALDVPSRRPTCPRRRLQETAIRLGAGAPLPTRLPRGEVRVAGGVAALDAQGASD